MKRKICVVTGTRADYGIMSRLMKRLSESEHIELQVVATNMHLAPEYGNTIREIERDGFEVNRRVDMLLTGDSPTATVKSMGLGTIGFADAFGELRPDYVLLLGDRYEMLSVASAALIFRIPVIHLYGGEVTEGAYDDAIRNAITQLSTYHFTSTAEYRENIIRAGIPGERVWHVGSLGVDNIRSGLPMSMFELNASIDEPLELSPGFILATFHPVTAGDGGGENIDEFFAALDMFPESQILFTMPNSDTGGRLVAEKTRAYVSRHPDRMLCVESLGRARYYSALEHCGAVIGNSSSGLIEAPSFGIPTLNIGNRQGGRARGNTVVDVKCKRDSIVEGLSKVLNSEFREYCKREGENPYAAPNTLDKMIEVIESLL